METKKVEEQTYVVCKNRQSRKVPLAVCLTNCKEQLLCDSFNEVKRETILEAAKKLGLVSEAPESEPVIEVEEEETEELAENEEAKPDTPQVQEESADTDVRQEIIERQAGISPIGKAQLLYQQVLSLKSEIEVRWFELGKILKEMKEGRHYIGLGYTTWKDFCLGHEMGLGALELRPRAVDYLITTTTMCEEVGIGKEVSGQIGWSKLKEIVPVITVKNKDQWLDVATQKGTTVQVLNAKVRVARGIITEEESKVLPEKMFFPLFKEQKKNVERTLELACRMTGSDSRGNQLEMVCAEFRATYESEDGEFSKGRIVSGLLERIEAVMKVKFTGEVEDVDTGEILVESK